MNGKQHVSLKVTANPAVSLALPACLAVIAASAATAAPNCAALLEEHGCVCAMAVPEAQATPIGQLSEIAGDILVSGPDGFDQTASAMPVSLGDSIIVPAGAGAVFTSSDATCRHALPSESNLVFRQVGECACASEVAANVDVEPTTGRIGAETAVTAAILAGGALATYLVLESMNNDDNPVSP